MKPTLVRCFWKCPLYEKADVDFVLLPDSLIKLVTQPPTTPNLTLSLNGLKWLDVQLDVITTDLLHMVYMTGK